MQRVLCDIKSNIFSKLYLLYGDESFLIDNCIEKIINALTDPDTKDMNLLKLSAEIPDNMKIDDFVNSYPFMADKKVLVIRNSGLFASSGKPRAITDEIKSYWSSLINDIPDYATIIFAENNVDKRSALYKQISKLNANHEFKFKDIPELAMWIEKGVKSLGISISRDTSKYLAENCGPSMANIRTELDKLANFKGNSGTITKNDIDSVCTKAVEDKVFDMINDLIAGNGNEARKKLNDLKTLKEEPVKIISIIFTCFSRFAQLKILQNKPVSEICSLTGIKHSFIVTNDLKKIKDYPYDKIKNVIMQCSKADFDIKSGKINGFTAIDVIFSEAIRNK